MKSIDFSKINENECIYLDDEKFANIAQIDKPLLLYTTNYNNHKHKFEQIAYLYDSQHILFTSKEYNYHFLQIIPRYSLINNNYIFNTLFTFYTDGNILKYRVSPNRNLVAIYFTVVNNYYDWLNGTTRIGQRDANRYFLNVYDVNQYSRKLILKKKYPNSININLSEIDTIAISSYINKTRENPYDISNLLEIYNLTTGKRILKQVVHYSIELIKFFPCSELYSNNLLIFAKDNDGEDTMRIIDLNGAFAQMYIKNISPYYVMCIDITSNGEIALGSESGLLYFNSFDKEPRLLYEDKIIVNVSFSNSGNKLAFTYYNEDNYGISIFSFENNSEIFNSQTAVQVFDDYILNNPKIKIIYSDEDDEEDQEQIVVIDPILDRNFENQYTKKDKLQIYDSENCFDIFEYIEENIGNYLSSDADNLVLFVKQRNDDVFSATCLKFSYLKKYLKHPNMIFYRCVQGRDFRAYHGNRFDFLKIPTKTQTIFVSYSDIREKYKQHQNMIFLEFDQHVEKTISHAASFTMDFVSSNHCQIGSDINVYRIIF
jgi:hypothetical protein